MEGRGTSVARVERCRSRMRGHSEEMDMKDSDIRHDVQGALERNASIDASAIAVAVDAGVVTLCGDVRTCAEKHDAERVALHVYGVNAVANELVVRAPEG